MKAIDQNINAKGSGIRFSNIIISKVRPSPPVNRATKKDTLVPYHPETKKIQVNPTNKKLISLDLKYFKTMITPKIIEIKFLEP